AHSLSDRLEIPGGNIETGFFGEAATALSQGVDKVVERINREVTFDSTRSRGDWDATTVASTLPFLDSGDERTIRTSLCERLENIQRRDREKPTGMLVPAKILKADHEEQARAMQQRAQLQGRLAVAALGQRWFDDQVVFKAPERGSYESTLATMM